MLFKQTSVRSAIINALSFFIQHSLHAWTLAWRQQRQTKRRHVQGMLDETDPLIHKKHGKLLQIINCLSVNGFIRCFFSFLDEGQKHQLTTYCLNLAQIFTFKMSSASE